jgi:Ca2+-transporting ATPase
MGGRGAQTSREVASIVLLDDNFRTIVRAIGEGQQLFRNLQLSFAYLLMAHAPLVVTAAAVPLMGEPLLYLPVHIVWLELIFHPTAILVFQYLPSAADLAPVDRSAKPRFFTMRQSAVIALAAFLATALVLYAYYRALSAAHEAEQARSAALACLVLASAAIGAGLSRFRTRTAAIACAAAALSAIMFIQTPFLARLMHLAPLGAGDWLAAGLGAAVVGVCASVLAESLRGLSA